MTGRIFLIVSWLIFAPLCYPATSQGLSELKRDETLAPFELLIFLPIHMEKSLGRSLGYSAGTPVYLLQIETVPQAFMWVDTPPDSNAGVAHALEHMLAAKALKDVMSVF